MTAWGTPAPSDSLPHDADFIDWCANTIDELADLRPCDHRNSLVYHLMEEATR